MWNKNFEINSNIYPKDLVVQAIDDFSQVAEITFNDQILTINDDEPQIIFNEFMNYLLALYNELN